MSTSNESNLQSDHRAVDNALKVREFHEAIGESPPLQPRIPDERLLALRRKLIEEENDEVMEALDRLAQVVAGHGDDPTATRERNEALARAAHELVDLLYVTYGALVWFGLDANELFAEVHAANMRKTEGPKRADGKQLKPPGWQPADVAAVIERQRDG